MNRSAEDSVAGVFIQTMANLGISVPELGDTRLDEFDGASGTSQPWRSWQAGDLLLSRIVSVHPVGRLSLDLQGSVLGWGASVTQKGDIKAKRKLDGSRRFGPKPNRPASWRAAMIAKDDSSPSVFQP